MRAGGTAKRDSPDAFRSGDLGRVSTRGSENSRAKVSLRQFARSVSVLNILPAVSKTGEMCDKDLRDQMKDQYCLGLSLKSVTRPVRQSRHLAVATRLNSNRKVVCLVVLSGKGSAHKPWG